MATRGKSISKESGQGERSKVGWSRWKIVVWLLSVLFASSIILRNFIPFSRLLPPFISLVDLRLGFVFFILSFVSSHAFSCYTLVPFLARLIFVLAAFFLDSRDIKLRQAARASTKMIDIIHQSDFIYRNASNLNNKLALTIAGTQVRDTNMVPGTNDANVFLTNYGKYLATGVTQANSNGPKIRGSTLPSSDQVCLNHMFTHLSMANGVVGVANLRAFCESR